MKNKTFVNPEELGKLLASLQSFSNEEKLELLDLLPYMSIHDLESLYTKLIEYKKIENQAITTIQKTNLKYSVLMKKEIEKLEKEHL